MTAPPFLGVARSLTGRRWEGPAPELARAADWMAQATGLAPAVAAVLAQRGVAPAEAEAFLTPRLRELLPDPRALRDIGPAAARLLAAAQGGERVAIFADYDVDGAASAALLVHWLRGFGPEPEVYVPDRLTEGYGPNPAAMARLAAAHDLIVCVDCGTLAHTALAAAEGADVVVLDHHLGGETLPPALAVVNPNRADEPGELGHLCAAGVVFLTLVEANRLSRAAGGEAPDLMALLDLVALATVADVAPLVGVNRALVRQGLRVMGQAGRPGIAALAAAARLDGAPSAGHLGFVLGPRINAGGRIGSASLGVRLLTTADPTEAATLAARLEALNAERQTVEAAVREAALAQAEARGTDGALIWAAGEAWHPGVIGIVAARLKEATGRPAVVIGLDGAVGKGSGRSAGGADLGAAVARLAREGALIAGGGHRMAAGLTVARDGVEAAMARLGSLLQAQAPDFTAAERLRLDAVLTPAAATADLIAALDQAGPFGAGAPAPRFALADVVLREVRRIGTGHLKLSLAGAGGGCREAVVFGAFDGPLGPALEAARGAPMHLAGRIELNRWGGREAPQLRVEDAAQAN